MEYKFNTEQFLPASVKQVWEFFSSPLNLARITPPEMQFKVLTRLTNEEIYEGMQIDYIVRPFGYFPLKWRTEIGKTIPLSEFTDRQIKGPYRKWEHVHMFVPKANGTLVTDSVVYRMPFGRLGRLAHTLFVRKRIETIFNYRREILKEIFE